MTKSFVAYIDADILLHRAISFCDDDFDGEPMKDVRQAHKFFDMLKDKWLAEVQRAVKLDDYFLVLSKGRTFRKDLYPDYKANRKDIVPHPALYELKDRVMELDGVIWEENMEADDLIGIRVTEDPSSRIAVSADKDFATLPIRLIIPASHGKKVGSQHSFTEDEANVNWLRQTMMGDVVDNYKGIPKIGPKKAEAILPGPAPMPVMWGAVEAAFVKAGLTPEYALTMARVARILRHGEYNFETKEVKLWVPPTSSR